MNRLATQTSPYLLQHRDNPVDWYPWGEEAFAAARARDVPVLLSVGYSTCHWCHVMAHESFEDEQVAEYMNAHFVNVKVDREERPDVDGIYMAAVQAMTGSGGWPMTVFLKPDTRPFYAGTYYPPQDMQGMPSFSRVLASVAGAWAEKRDTLESNAEALTAHIREASQPPHPQGETGPDAQTQALATLARQYDPQWGGFGGAPKFPSPGTLRFLLAAGGEGAQMARHTLDMMLRGGLYDQLGGGFARYSTDRQWLVPHFEKMLYDNAQLIPALLDAWQLSGEAHYRTAVRETLGYLLREMRGPGGGFYSAQDADSEGTEGKYFVWTPAEIRALLGDTPTAERVIRYYGVTGAGNFMDPHHREFGRRSVLHRPDAEADWLARERLSAEEWAAELAPARAALLAAREARVHPGTDTKCLSSWNGLALIAFADAARVLGDAGYLRVAEDCAAFVERELVRDGQLLHTYKDGQAQVAGLLEDHALYALGLLSLYRAGGDLRHYRRAVGLWQTVLSGYWDEQNGSFYSTGPGAEALLARRVEAFDAGVTGPHAAATLLAAWLGRYQGNPEATRIAERAVLAFLPQMQAAPSGFGTLWQALALLQSPHSEVAVLGEPAERAALERELARHHLPYTVLATARPGEVQPGDPEVLTARGGAGVAYVCRHHACDLPTSDPAVLRGQLDALNSAAAG